LEWVGPAGPGGGGAVLDAFYTVRFAGAVAVLITPAQLVQQGCRRFRIVGHAMRFADGRIVAGVAGGIWVVVDGCIAAVGLGQNCILVDGKTEGTSELGIVEGRARVVELDE